MMNGVLPYCVCSTMSFYNLQRPLQLLLCAPFIFHVVRMTTDMNEYDVGPWVVIVEHFPELSFCPLDDFMSLCGWHNLQCVFMYLDRLCEFQVNNLD